MGELFQQVLATDVLSGKRGQQSGEIIGELETQRVMQDLDRAQESRCLVRPGDVFQSGSQAVKGGWVVDVECRRAQPLDHVYSPWVPADHDRARRLELAGKIGADDYAVSVENGVGHGRVQRLSGLHQTSRRSAPVPGG